MSRQKHILVIFLAIGVVVALGYENFGWKNYFKSGETGKIAASLTTLSQSNDQSKHNEYWEIFQDYLEFARTHNLAGIRNLSHQISDTCNDPEREAECFTLMDSVYIIGSSLEATDFKHVLEDERQIIMFTNGPAVAMLFFTKDEGGNIKMLGLRFCFEDETTVGTCLKTGSARQDSNNNGWWDNVESLFYR